MVSRLILFAVVVSSVVGIAAYTWFEWPFLWAFSLGMATAVLAGLAVRLAMKTDM